MFEKSFNQGYPQSLSINMKNERASIKRFLTCFNTINILESQIHQQIDEQ